MKPRKSSPLMSEPRGIDFIPKMKSNEKGVVPSITLENNDVKQALESAMTLIFQSFTEIHKLQRKAREVRDGS